MHTLESLLCSALRSLWASIHRRLLPTVLLFCTDTRLNVKSDLNDRIRRICFRLARMALRSLIQDNDTQQLKLAIIKLDTVVDYGRLRNNLIHNIYCWTTVLDDPLRSSERTILAFKAHGERNRTVLRKALS